MTPEERAKHVARQWSQDLPWPLGEDESSELVRLTTEVIAAATADEAEACAAVVNQHLNANLYHPQGLPGVLRERARELRTPRAAPSRASADSPT